MADNYVSSGDKKFFAVPATAASAGAPVEIGEGLTGITLTDRTTGGSATVDIGRNVYNLEVKAVNDVGNTTLATWDQVYITMADTPQLNKKASGNFFGFAFGSISTSGATSTIPVLHESGSGPGVADSKTLIAAGIHTTSNSTSNSVTVAGASATDGDVVMASSGTSAFTVSAYVSSATEDTVHITTSAAATGGTIHYQVMKATS